MASTYAHDEPIGNVLLVGNLVVESIFPFVYCVHARYITSFVVDYSVHYTHRIIPLSALYSSHYFSQCFLSRFPSFSLSFFLSFLLPLFPSSSLSFILSFLHPLFPPSSLSFFRTFSFSLIDALLGASKLRTRLRTRALASNSAKTTNK
eukprot:GHVU01220322.1.p1 GENE.GHVU01220322.1~~GHVU01220322.1.p1  ORF type:complete len:149 (+),score=2.38 GHVU01220322.1:715-1161(+)